MSERLDPAAVSAPARVAARRTSELIVILLALLAYCLSRIARRGRAVSGGAPPTTAVSAGPGRRRRSAAMAGTDPGLSIATAVALSGLDQGALWLAYASIGGDNSPQQVSAFLQGDLTLPAHDTRVLAHVVNEHFRQQGISNPVKEE